MHNDLSTRDTEPKSLTVEAGVLEVLDMAENDLKRIRIALGAATAMYGSDISLTPVRAALVVDSTLGTALAAVAELQLHIITKYMQ